MPRIRTAHKFSERQRTGDVLTDELVDFKSLLLSPDVLKGLNSSGFERPSPIQLKAIPLGRCGLDLIAQAKSGTGKTCVFSVIALESVLPETNTTQVLILAPTREIAVQIKDVITAIGSQMERMVCHVFIGGLPVEENKKMLKKPCHIAVGTPGRIKYLIENHFLKTESVRLFILDEADKLLEDSFQEQINWIFSSLPSNKQMMAFSATYPEYLAKHLTRYMREPTFVRLNATDPTLQGIKQFYKLVPFHPLPHKTFQEKVSELLKLLSSLPFHQCLVFSNYQIRAQSLCDTLHLKGWPSVFIAGSQTQTQRLKAMERLKQFKCRVLISTDLTSRGIDAENVNVVVNMDVPRDSETYLHRIGRAGRFGTQGVAVTFVAKGEEEKLFKRIEENIGTTIDVLPDPIPQSLGTSCSPNELDSKPVQTRATAVEVDILKGDSTQELDDLMDKNNSHENEIQHSTRNCDDTVDAANETVCVEDGGSDDGELREQESLKTDAEVMINKGSLQNLETESDKRVCVNTETEDVVANIGERLQRCLHINQNCEKKSISEKQVDRRNCEITVSQPQTSAAETDLQDTCEVSSSNDLKDSESKTAHKPSFKFAAFENSSESLEESLSILQVGSHSDSRHSCIKQTTNDLVNEGIGVRHNTLPSKKGKTTDQKLFKSLADESNSSESQSENETTSDSDGESEDSSGGLNLDEHDNTDRASGTGDSLPPVEEFDRDFEEYLQNCSNDLLVLGNSVEDLSHSSELSDDTEDDSIHSEDALYCINVKDEDYDRTPSEAYEVTQHCNTLPDTYYQIPHQDCHSNIGYYYGQHIDAQNQTDNSTCGTDHQENILSERSWNYHDHPYTSFWDGYNWLNNNNYYNYYSDQGYNNFPTYHGNYTTNWQAYTQGQGDTAIAQQYVGQYYGDTASYQEYQWNASWYNAYHRQTSRIMQFVSFSRSARL